MKIERKLNQNSICCSYCLSLFWSFLQNILALCCVWQLVVGCYLSLISSFFSFSFSLVDTFQKEDEIFSFLVFNNFLFYFILYIVLFLRFQNGSLFCFTYSPISTQTRRFIGRITKSRQRYWENTSTPMMLFFWFPFRFIFFLLFFLRWRKTKTCETVEGNRWRGPLMSRSGVRNGRETEKKN